MRGVAVFEDLGAQTTRHSALNSYLDNLLCLLTGSFARPDAINPAAALIPRSTATSTSHS